MRATVLCVSVTVVIGARNTPSPSISGGRVVPCVCHQRVHVLTTVARSFTRRSVRLPTPSSPDKDSLLLPMTLLIVFLCAISLLTPASGLLVFIVLVCVLANTMTIPHCSRDALHQSSLDQAHDDAHRGQHIQRPNSVPECQ